MSKTIRILPHPDHLMKKVYYFTYEMPKGDPIKRMLRAKQAFVRRSKIEKIIYNLEKN